MNAIQTNKLRMFISTDATLDKYSSVFSSVPAIVQCQEEFGEIISSVQDLSRAQGAKNGYGQARTRALEEVSEAAHAIAGAVHACAVAAGNEPLAARTDFSRSNITKGRDSAALARFRDIHALATENLSALSDYNVSAADLTAFKKKTDAFQKFQTKPRQGVAESSSATKQLTELFQQADVLLNRRLDRLVVKFRSAEPAFFNEYTAARVIVNNPGGRVSKEKKAASGTSASTPTTKAA